MERLSVRITSVNKNGKFDYYYINTETMINATRLILTYMPKRGYKVVEYNIELVEVLV